MTEDQINALTFAALREYRPEGLFHGGELQVSWGASSRAVGLAHYPVRANDRPSIRYSRPLMAALPEHEQRDTVIHEVAHLLTSDDWMRRATERMAAGLAAGRPPAGHGLEWRVWMIKMGGKPAVTCRDPRVNQIGLAMLREKRKARPDWLTGKCSCREWSISLERAGRHPHCPKCFKPVVFPRAENLAICVHLAARGRALPNTPTWLIEKAKGLTSWTETSRGRAKIVALARELAGSIGPAS